MTGMARRQMPRYRNGRWETVEVEESPAPLPVCPLCRRSATYLASVQVVNGEVTEFTPHEIRCDRCKLREAV